MGQYIIQSLANKRMLNVILVVISFIKIKNINGPRTVLWGTPGNTGCKDEDLPVLYPVVNLPLYSIIRQFK